MTDKEKIINLLSKYNVDFHTDFVYSIADNEPCGYIIWLGKGGHIEFNLDEQIIDIEL